VELLGGLGVAAKTLQGEAKVSVGLGVVRLQAQGSAATARRAVELAQRPVGFSQVGMKGRDVRLQGHGPADLLHGPSMQPLLIVEHADQVQRSGVVLFLDQDFLIQLRGWPQLPGLMQF